jgi:hypothetical protein
VTRQQLYIAAAVLGVVIGGCRASIGEDPRAIRGPVADVEGQVLRGTRSVVGARVLTRITAGTTCRAHDSAPGGTVISIPTDSSGHFRTAAFAAPGAEQEASCLHVGAIDAVRAETVWAAPRPMPSRGRRASPTASAPTVHVDVRWPE